MHNAQHTMHNGQWSMVKAQSPKLTAKVYMSNMIADSRHSASFYTTTVKTSYSSHTEYIPHEVPVVYIDESNGGGDAITVYEEVTVYDTIITTKMVQTDQHIHHRQPIRFGLSLRYQLDDRWSVESGLSYTRLSSDITTVEAGMTTVTEQRLNYIGLPLNVGYDLWKKRTFGLLTERSRRCRIPSERPFQPLCRTRLRLLLPRRQHHPHHLSGPSAELQPQPRPALPPEIIRRQISCFAVYVK